MADPIREALEHLLAADDCIHVASPEYVQAREAARAALAAEPPAPAQAIPLDLDALLSPEGAYEPGTGQEDGAQLVDQLQWWAPMHGCETLENLLDRIRRQILPHLRPPIAGIDVPGPDGDYGGLQELCDAEGVDVRIGAPLLKRAREAWGATQPPAPAPAADGAARLRQCPTHGQQPANAWACPECLRELREELARLKAPAADGEREELARLLDGDATHLVEVALARECSKTWELARRVDRAAALLRQPAPAPVPGWQPLPDHPPVPQPPQGGEVEP